MIDKYIYIIKERIYVYCLNTNTDNLFTFCLMLILSTYLLVVVLLP